MAEHGAVEKKAAFRLGTAGAISMGLTLSAVPALLIGVGFAKLFNALAGSEPIGMVNVVSIGALLALTSILCLLIQIREETRSRG